MFELTILSEFEAAHRLPEYQGKCCRLHGHNWRVEVTLTGAQLDKQGMLIDFKEFKQEVNGVLATLDHYYLNDTPPFREINPTAENIAQYIFDELSKSALLNVPERGIRVSLVKVWESPYSAAAYSRRT
ncbi:MAG: 6-carboxytetrahydropterin synthase QueD [Negativicutes bacterium]|nr:6-carboxytetrahydropterin synthase QueD [Negativicutes bacterium]